MGYIRTLLTFLANNLRKRHTFRTFVFRHRAAQVPDGRLRKRVFLAWARVRLLLIPQVERRFLGKQDRAQPRARPERRGGFAAYRMARHPDMGMPAQAEGAGGYARIVGVYAEPHFPDENGSGYAREYI